MIGNWPNVTIIGVGGLACKKKKKRKEKKKQKKKQNKNKMETKRLTQIMTSERTWDTLSTISLRHIYKPNPLLITLSLKGRRGKNTHTMFQLTLSTCRYILCIPRSRNSKAKIIFSIFYIHFGHFTNFEGALTLWHRSDVIRWWGYFLVSIERGDP